MTYFFQSVILNHLQVFRSDQGNSFRNCKKKSFKYNCTDKNKALLIDITKSFGPFSIAYRRQ